MTVEEFKFVKPGEVRLRIAPAPTGKLHIGLARTALFNYLFAKKHQGSFILRIENTDRERSKSEFEKDIIENLKWLGMEWDEGPDVGGNYRPYRQSQRSKIYKKYLEGLLAQGKAYYCFCSEEELEAQRQYQMSIGQAPIYNGKCRELSPEIVKKLIIEGKKSIIRFKTPLKKIEFNDLIRGKIEFEAALIGDFSIAKNFSSPLYNFACVVDDFEMRISHIMRGEEHISNTPKQILIQEALGFPSPEYVHLPLILGPDRTKLSKRHGATSIGQYKSQGYLPEALINFMAFLGWNPGGEREIYSLPSLIKEFSLERVQKGGAIFNIKKLDFLTGFYIRHRSIEKLTELCLPYLFETGLIKPIFETEKGVPDLTGYFGQEIVSEYLLKETEEKINFDYLKKIVAIYQERLKKLSEISELTNFFFRDKLEYDKNLLRWAEMPDNEVILSIDRLEKILSKIKTEEFNKENLEKILIPEAEKFSKEIRKKAGLSAAALAKAGLPAEALAKAGLPAEALAKAGLPAEALAKAGLPAEALAKEGLPAEALAKEGLPAEALAKAGERGYLLWPLRVALTGKEASAGPFEIAEILGKEKSIKRIKGARELF